ncbi:hypothetical protein [Schauerella aestuarii]|uniref:hypothetical protein n=1 Tax=Schauerella aestuarii TaxID=2511204 RepID=UPI0013700D50|nr:hypothetical protein [Achromobacter aestuarii]MYZ43606.1 hypothetical protein [Achromobacter aestuarii]
MNVAFWLALAGGWLVCIMAIWFLLWRAGRSEQAMLRIRLQRVTHPGVSITGQGFFFIRYTKSHSNCIEYFAHRRMKRQRLRALQLDDDVNVLEHGSARSFDWLRW